MAISDKSRKILWGRSGNTCAHCRHTLVMKPAKALAESVVGVECHIYPRSHGGPRSDATPPTNRDSHENLILLCPICHKIIDDQPDAFTADSLLKMKRGHERWVEDTLRAEKEKSTAGSEKAKVKIVPRLATGRELLDVILNTHAYEYWNDVVDEQKEELIGGFLQNVVDYADILHELGPAGRVNAQRCFESGIEDLESHGLLVFGRRSKKRMSLHNEDIGVWDLAQLYVVRQENPAIVFLGAFASVEDNLSGCSKVCPHCKKNVIVEQMDTDTGQFTEGQQADYEMGWFGSGICPNCGETFDWG